MNAWAIGCRANEIAVKVQPMVQAHLKSELCRARNALDYRTRDQAEWVRYHQQRVATKIRLVFQLQPLKRSAT